MNRKSEILGCFAAVYAGMAVVIPAVFGWTHSIYSASSGSGGDIDRQALISIIGMVVVPVCLAVVAFLFRHSIGRVFTRVGTGRSFLLLCAAVVMAFHVQAVCTMFSNEGRRSQIARIVRSAVSEMM